jgi:hypothetical protein
MLVNPIIISLGNDDYQGINSAFKEQYQQAEEMRLFEGWDFKETKSFLDFSDGEGRIVWSKKSNNLFTLNNKFAYGDNITLNGFITLCNLTGVKLQFKKLQNAKRD